MEELSRQRMLSGDPPAILPVVFRALHPLPSTASRLKYRDLSRSAVQRADVHRSKQFRDLVQEIVNAAIEIAEVIRKRDVAIGHTSFRLPDNPIWVDKRPALPTLPMRVR